jgi:hypothetical protein
MYTEGFMKPLITGFPFIIRVGTGERGEVWEGEGDCARERRRGGRREIFSGGGRPDRSGSGAKVEGVGRSDRRDRRGGGTGKEEREREAINV